MTARNIELARAICGAWERRDFTATDWADPEIEFGFADGPEPSRGTGLPEMAARWFAFERSWESLQFQAIDFRELDGEHVFIRNRFGGRARGSALDLSAVPALQASVMQFRHGKVVKLLLYWHAEQALADLGIEQ